MRMEAVMASFNIISSGGSEKNNENLTNDRLVGDEFPTGHFLIKVEKLLAAYVCVRVHVCMYACMHMLMYACVYVCMHVCVYDQRTEGVTMNGY
jgi:hypothetical protein